MPGNAPSNGSQRHLSAVLDLAKLDYSFGYALFSDPTSFLMSVDSLIPFTFFSPRRDYFLSLGGLGGRIFFASYWLFYFIFKSE